MMAFANLPSNAKSVRPFELAVSDVELKEFKELLKHSKIPPVSWESAQVDRKYGVTHSWLTSARERWLNGFDWRACEKHINSFPNFKATVIDEGQEYEVHFVALFSKKASAIPIIASHGWPGSFLEFLPIMSLARKQYTPETMPYHFIAPSLPGYTLSSSSGPTKPLTVEQATRILNSLMLNLGFASGYVAQGGDVGSSVARTMGAKHEACKAVHLNYCSMRAPPAHIPVESLDTKDRAFVERGQAFKAKGSAYAQEHGTRPATIGFVLSSNPLALLAWIGEKFLEWTDEDPSIDEILEVVSMYWFTDTISRCLYPYRQTMDGQRAGHDDPSLHIRKPFGYSLFPKEVNPTPRSWAATTGNLSWFRQHESGGHFAALEKPEALKQDIEDFLRHVQDQGVPLGRKE